MNVTTASGTSPTLAVVVEDSIDGGATWNTIGSFAQKTAAGREVINITEPFSVGPPRTLPLTFVRTYNDLTQEDRDGRQGTQRAEAAEATRA